MNYEKLLENLGDDFQVRENEIGFELYDTSRNLIAIIKSKKYNITFKICNGFNKLSRMTRRMVLYELKRFCQEETEKRGIHEKMQDIR